MKYSDKLIEMRGIITEVHDGAVSIDFKGRLGSMKLPMRMLITDYELKEGMEVGMKMSFVEVLSDKIDEKYLTNKQAKSERCE
jgi:FKBP-type peptidyl-prolyl cis-trans isomerase 2